MIEETLVNPEENPHLHDNPEHQLDLTYSLPDGGYLKAEGIENDGQVVDVQFIAKRNAKQRPEKYKLKTEVATDYPIDKTWIKRMIVALGDQAKEWLGIDSLYDILDAIGARNYELPGSPEYPTDSAWINSIDSRINSVHYNHDWDFEEFRQDGESFYDEWRDNTNDMRN